MLTALTAPSSAATTALSSGPSPAVLKAQLSKYQTQLADWENCPSCKTPEGKKKIAEINASIKDVEQRLQASGQAADAPLQPQEQSTAPAGQVTATLGQRVNAFA